MEMEYVDGGGGPYRSGDDAQLLQHVLKDISRTHKEHYRYTIQFSITIETRGNEGLLQQRIYSTRKL